jgi:hypothetical protein
MTSKPVSIFRRAVLAAAAGLAFGGAAQAALIDRGGGMIYDSVLNITWLQNWNQAVGTPFDFFPPGSGRMTWPTARAWADSLVWGGFDDWRLPTMVDTGSPGCTFSYAGGTDCGYNVQTIGGGVVFSEMAHLWYVTLGNKAFCDPATSTATTCVEQEGWGLRNRGPFTNMQSGIYWTGLPNALQPEGSSWIFLVRDGGQTRDGIGMPHFAVAVRDGDVAAVIPEPATWAMLGLGLAALAVVRRRGGR